MNNRSRPNRARGIRALVLGMLALFAVSLAAASSNAALAVQILTVRTGDFGDGKVDHIRVTFNTGMDAQSALQKSSGEGEPGFEVEGFQIDRFEWVAAQGTPTTTLLIHLVEQTVDTAITPAVHYRSGGGGAVAQTAGLGEAEDWTGDAADGAGPVLLSFKVNDQGNANLFNNAADEAWLSFSEPALLTGATPRDQWTSLERAIKFSNDTVTVCQDGTADPTQANRFNFPQPTVQAAPNDPAADPVLAPSAGEAVATFHIKRLTATSSGAPIVGTPDYCWAGIDSATGFASHILDGAGNAASAINQLENVRVRITPVDSKLLVAATADAVSGTADGDIDALRLTFDQRIDDATFEANLGLFEVKNGEEVATVSSFSTGSTVDDASVVLGLEDLDWDGAIRPTVSYSKPGDCTNTAGSPGIKSIVPSGGSWRACLGSFSLAAIDGVAPVIARADTLDVDEDGLLDKLSVKMTEPVTVATGSGWTVNGSAATAAAHPSDGNRVLLSFAEGSTPNTSALPAYAYTTQAAGGGAGVVDSGANQPAAGTRTATHDKAAPRIIEAAVLDTNADAKIDRLETTYSEQVADPATGSAAGFSVAGNAGSSIARVDGDTLAVTVAPVDGTGAKDVAYTPAASIADAAGNDATTQAIAAASVKDLAAPRATIIITPTAPLSAGESTVTAAFSEEMLTSVAPTATLGSLTVNPVSDANHTNGWRIADPTKWDGTVTIASDSCAVATGCAVTVSVDGASDDATPANAQAPASLETEIDTIAPAAPTLGSLSIGLADGETAPADTVNMFVRSLGLGGTIAADAGNGSAKIVLDGASEFGLDDAIAEGDTSVQATKSFADAEAVRALLTDGSHTLALKVCDDAANCSTSADTKAITVDTTAVSMDLTGPAGGNIVEGGSAIDVTWDAGDETDFDHVELDYSTDGGATYPNAIDHAVTDRDGTRSWTTPEIDSGAVTVRAIAVDASGNKSSAGSDTFTIDSSAPVVTLGSVPAFLPAGEAATIRWNVSDATIDEADEPIVIEYSSNNGSTWQPINAGIYSRDHDGDEVWNVPGGVDYDTKVRVTATDAVGRSATVTSGRLVRGVAGYTVAEGGRVYAFGSAESTTNESLSKSGDWVRGLAMRSNGSAGYVLSSTGRLYPFSTGTATVPAKPKTTAFSGDDARGVVLRSDTSGYILRDTGKIYAFGGAPKARTSGTWTCDCARGIVLKENGRGGYVLDAYGRLHPFAVGSYSMPKRIQSSKLYDTKKAVGFVLRDSETSGYILEKTGNVRAFGGAPAVDEVGDGSTKTAVAIVRFTQSSGYWVDNTGRLYTWGSAYGNPTKTAFSSTDARGAAGI